VEGLTQRQSAPLPISAGNTNATAAPMASSNSETA
jgi:hypothetical protein